MNFKNIFLDIGKFELKSKIIGKGSFATVHLAENKEDHNLYACKIYCFPESTDNKDEIHIMNESSILSTLDHPSVIKFVGISFKSFEDPSQYQPSLMTEYLENDTLRSIFDKEKMGLCPIEWTTTKKFICLIGISSAMKHIHSHSILHRDLKPENIFIDKDYNPKIGGFGISRSFSHHLTNEMDLTEEGQVGTITYMAPELFEENLIYGPCVDVFSFSLIAYEIVTGQRPYREIEHLSHFALIQKILSGYRPAFPDYVPIKMKQLIEKCWNEDKSKRPSFNEIFSELANDFSYFEDDVDEDEVNAYLEMINEESH